jgi:hypothetical protein
MSPTSQSPSARPLSILAVVSDQEPCRPGVLAALKRHYTLFCQSVQQALESAPSFEPNVVVYDPSLADGDFLAHRLNDSFANHETAFVALRSIESELELSAEIRYSLDAPISESELESVLRQIGHQLESDRSLTRTSA